MGKVLIVFILSVLASVYLFCRYVAIPAMLALGIYLMLYHVLPQLIVLSDKLS